MSEEVAIVKREIVVAKEIDEVMVFLEAVLVDAKAGKSAQEIGAGNLTKFLAAVQGLDQVDDEVKANRKAALQTIGMHMGTIADLLLSPSAAAPQGGVGGPI